MSLNIAKGNMYPWVTHTWNTVKGACPHGCTYCYMKRWGKQRPAYFDKRELKTDLGEGNFIFVGSSCDMFAGYIPMDWAIDTLSYCRGTKNKYLFQSKNPAGFGLVQNYNDSVDATLCTTIETNRWYGDIMCDCPRPEDRADAMGAFVGYPRYVTIEPILAFDLGPLVELVKRCEPLQVNIGADSGGNNLPEPSRAEVIALMDALGSFTHVEPKANLKRIIE